MGVKNWHCVYCATVRDDCPSPLREAKFTDEGERLISSPYMAGAKSFYDGDMAHSAITGVLGTPRTIHRLREMEFDVIHLQPLRGTSGHSEEHAVEGVLRIHVIRYCDVVGKGGGLIKIQNLNSHHSYVD